MATWEDPMAINEEAGASVYCGRYEVVETLKPGGMARVFKVFDRETKTYVALKLPLTGSDDSLAVLAYQRELEALENLHHPNIVRLLDSGRSEDGEQYLALEWLPACLNDQLTKDRSWQARWRSTKNSVYCGRYEVVETLKPGGMARVFKSSTGRPKPTWHRFH
jgi:serine/threonine protein kinase